MKFYFFFIGYLLSFGCHATCTLDLSTGRTLTVNDLTAGLTLKSGVFREPIIHCDRSTQITLWMKSKQGSVFAHETLPSLKRPYQLHIQDTLIRLPANQFVMIGHFLVQKTHQLELKISLKGTEHLPDGLYQDTLIYRLEPLMP
jgi:hypothetical protein